MSKEASLLPGDMLSGGRVPDGRYIIKSATAETFDYGGKANEVPAACIVFKGADGTEHEQYYSAGDLQYLVPASDKTAFVHPGGDTAKLSLNSNFGKFMSAMLNAGFPQAEVSSKLACLVDADVEMVSFATPTQNKKDATLLLPAKYHGRAKGKGQGARPAPARTASAANGQATSAAPAASVNVDDAAVIAIQTALQSVPEKDGVRSIPLAKLSTSVMLQLAKVKDPNAQAIKKLAADESWMTANGEAGGWVVDEGNAVLVA